MVGAAPADGNVEQAFTSAAAVATAGFLFVDVCVDMAARLLSPFARSPTLPFASRFPFRASPLSHYIRTTAPRSGLVQPLVRTNVENRCFGRKVATTPETDEGKKIAE